MGLDRVRGHRAGSIVKGKGWKREKGKDAAVRIWMGVAALPLGLAVTRYTVLPYYIQYCSFVATTPAIIKMHS